MESRGARFNLETERCARALRGLSEETEGDGDNESTANIAIPMLVSSLSATLVAAADAAWAIANLTSASVSPRLHSLNRALVYEAGGVPPLVAQLNRSGKAAASAAMALQNLSAPASHQYSKAVVDAIFIAIIAMRGSDRMPSLDNFPHLCERIRTAASQRLQRATLGSDALSLQAAIENARAVELNEAEMLAQARERVAKLRAADNVKQEQATSKAQDAQEERLKALGMGQAEVDKLMETPADFCCPLTMERFVDPVCVSDGHTYERDAIMMVLGSSGNRVSPLTREPLQVDFVVPNFALLKRLRCYEEEMIQMAERAQAALVTKG